MIILIWYLNPEKIFGPMEENDGDSKLPLSLETYIIN